MLRYAFLIAFLPTVAFAVPEHMQREIEAGLREHRIEADLSKLSQAQLTALHFELTSMRRTIPRRLISIIESGGES